MVAGEWKSARDAQAMTKRARKLGERERFEAWMRLMWRGVKLDWVEYAEEYRSTAAQVAWEVWQLRAADEKRRGQA